MCPIPKVRTATKAVAIHIVWLFVGGVVTYGIWPALSLLLRLTLSLQGFAALGDSHPGFGFVSVLSLLKVAGMLDTVGEMSNLALSVYLNACMRLSVVLCPERVKRIISTSHHCGALIRAISAVLGCTHSCKCKVTCITASHHEKRFLVRSHLCLFVVYVFENFADFPQLKKKCPHKGNVEQVQAPDQSNQDRSFHNQNMCSKEGLQIDKCRSKYKAPMVYKQNR